MRNAQASRPCRPGKIGTISKDELERQAGRHATWVLPRPLMRWALVSFLFLLSLSLLAQSKSHVKASLLADHDQIVKGQTFFLGIHLKMSDHWHTYWENPGASGLPTTVTWRPVPGLEIKPIQFPFPETFKDDADFITFGYAQETLLIAEATYTGDAEAIALAAEVNWLECKELCIPGKQSVQLSLKVGAPENSVNGALFAKYLKQIPQVYTADLPFEYEAAFAFENTSWKGTLTVSPRAPGLWQATKAATAFVPLGTEHADYLGVHTTVDGDSFTYTLNYEPYEEGGAPADLTLAAVVRLPLGEDGSYFRLPLYPKQLKAAAPTADPGGAPDPEPAPVSDGGSQSYSIFFILLLAFLGGMVLNLMPCVLPVLSLKIMAFIQESGESNSRRIAFGWVYTLGIMISFFVLSLFFIASKSAGEELGVGFQFQNPTFVIGMAALLFVMGLSFFGVFTFGAPSGQGLANLSQKKGIQGAFFQGLLMTLLSTPCTAPGLGLAYFWAITAGTFEILLIFQVVAFGLASPYLLLCYSPFLMKYLPKPGAWMENFKISMGFLLIATVIWLLDILAELSGTAGVTGVLTFLLGLGFAAWIYGQTMYTSSRWRGVAMALLVAAAGYYLGLVRLFDARAPFSQKKAYEENLRLTFLSQADGGVPEDLFSQLEAMKTTAEKLVWVPFSPANLEHFRKQNRLVFLDFTAAWCMTCKANEKLVINTHDIRAAFEERNVVTIKVDYTTKDDEITKILKSFNRAGVPLYVFYPGEGDPIVLPETITKSILLDGLNEAAASLSAKHASL